MKFCESREAFCEFDPNLVANMGEKEITEIASNKAIMLQESRVRCIVDNARCITKASSHFSCEAPLYNL